MLKTLNEIRGCTLQAKDGEIGTVRDVFYYDDHWTTRYLVVNTSNWLLGRRVLLLPSLLGEFDDSLRTIGVNLTRRQVREGPKIDTDRPLSHDEEMRLHGHFNWSMTWGGVSAEFPILSVPGIQELQIPAKEDVPTATQKTHPRSAKELEGFYVQTLDGHMGHVDEVLINTNGWYINYLLLNTKNWLHGKTVVIPARAFSKTDWINRSITADLTQDEIMGSPEYNEIRLGSQPYLREIQEYFDAHHHV